MNTKSVLSLFIFALFITSSVAFASDEIKLPDYKNDAKAMKQLKCDGGESTVTIYKGKDYGLILFTTKSGHKFYAWFFNNSTKELYAILEPRASTVVEYGHLVFDQKLFKFSRNLFNDLHRYQSDCTVSK